jgi:hypothetical protein
MKLAEEFRQNADEWRQIGKIAATDEHRRLIAEVANTWLAWAERRESMLTAGKQREGASGPGRDGARKVFARSGRRTRGQSVDSDDCNLSIDPAQPANRMR